MTHVSQKILVAMLALVITLLVILWAFQLNFLERGYLESRQEELISQTRTLAQMMNEGEDTTDYIERIGRRYNIGVMILSARGNIIYGSRTFTSDEYLAGRDLWLYSEGAYSHIIEFVESNSRYVLAMVPLDNGTGLVTIKHLADVTETVDILWRQFTIITIALSVSAALISIVLSRVLARSIRSLEQQATALAQGDLNTEIKPQSKDEIGRLAHTLEYLRQSLKKSDRLRRELIGNVSHELKTPLSIIKGFAETVRDLTWKDDEKRERQLNAIIDEADRLTKVVENILDYSQLESGAVKYKFEVVDLSGEAARICELQREYLRKGGMELECRIQEGLSVWGDVSKLGQVVFNLISNAFNHASSGGAVEVELSREGDKVFLRVIDHGEGIPKAELENIWQRYYRATERSREERMGSGMGLAIVQSILEAHKAEYGVNSELGQGSEFYFALPVYETKGSTGRQRTLSAAKGGKDQ